LGRVMPRSAPLSPSIHTFVSNQGWHPFVVDGSRIYDLHGSLAAEIDELLRADERAIASLLARYGLDEPPYIDDEPLVDPPIRSLSLSVAQKCNLACAYCYAQGGGFGGSGRNMSWPTARGAVLRLLDGTAPGTRVNISFLGGEPLINRALIRQVTEFAIAEARARQVRIGFLDYALSSAVKAWYKTGRGSARPSLLFFTEPRISAGRR
jgi:uncharacterized protein